MIVTLTPNPSLDLLFGAGRLVWDDANRVATPRRRPGGQGINVVRAARALAGVAAEDAPPASPGAGPVAHAIAPMGGVVGRALMELLEAEGTPLTTVPIAGETRVFVGVRESETGRSLLLNPRGPEASEAEAELLLAAIESVLPETTDTAPWFATCGSLLPGLPADFYREAGRIARARGARFVPDGDGDALAAAVPEADLLIPNELEAGRLVGRAIDSPQAAAVAARELRGRGPERVVITLGEAGAVGVDADGAFLARPVAPGHRGAVLSSASAVGAGDAFLAGLLLALDAGGSLAESLQDAVAAGTAALLSEGADLVRPADAAEVRDWVELEAVPDHG